MPKVEMEEVAEIFRGYGLSESEVQPIVAALKEKPAAWVDFMMRFELGLEKPDPGRGMQSALVIGGAYVVGGLIPLWPYMVMHELLSALWVSATVTLSALLVFGYIKGRYTGVKPIKSAIQTGLIGGIAAAVAFGIAKAISG